MKVFTTGMPWRRANARSSPEAPPRITPLPAKISGKEAASRSWAAACSAGRSGDGRRARSVDSGVPSAGSSATSSGTSMWHAPGFSVSASLKALRMTSGITAETSSRVFHLVSGRSDSTMSTYWCDSLWMRSRPAWPVMATRGARSRLASATPVARLVAPGPSVARQTPARPVSRPQASAMNAAPCSWRVGTNWIRESTRESMMSRISSPGTPKT